jgi:hypothetical protein
MHHPFHIHDAGRFLVLARAGANVGRWMAHCQTGLVLACLRRHRHASL